MQIKFPEQKPTDEEFIKGLKGFRSYSKTWCPWHKRVKIEILYWLLILWFKIGKITKIIPR